MAGSESSRIMMIMRPLRWFFHLLYHQLAWSYDLVAGIVSLGRWKGWVWSVLPWMEGSVLELAFGAGHLQTALQERGEVVIGLDESRQMARQASRRLRRKGFPANLAIGYAQRLPFPSGLFNTVVATFPSEYIFEAGLLAETRRVLAVDGKLVILPAAWITGKGPLERLAAALFRVTGQAGSIQAVIAGFEKRLQASGFQARHELVKLPGSLVLVISGKKGGI
jgi:ubiquinone/menaquinone biosynthesis C-methylase UbiE